MAARGDVLPTLITWIMFDKIVLDGLPYACFCLARRVLGRAHVDVDEGTNATLQVW